MQIQRRDFIKLLATSSLMSTKTLFAQISTESSERLNSPIGSSLFSCFDDPQGKHYFSLLNQKTGKATQIALTQRGHGICLSPNKKHCLVFARRPGTLIWIFDTQSHELVQQISSQTDRHFYGHGIFDAKGQYLYVAENDFETGRGVIGVYNAFDKYKRIHEFSSHGIGPHELAFLSDKKTLVIANGGIKTHPDLGRSKLNLKTMQPNLTYFDTSSNQFIQSYRLSDELNQLSMRHISVGSDDTVCIAMQYQGAKSKHPPLLALHKQNQAISLTHAPEAILKKMKNYCGSICHDPSGDYFAMSSPRGDLVSFWKTTGQYLYHIEMPDGCGLATGNKKGEVLISSGQGQLLTYKILEQQSTVIQQTSAEKKNWDNHMLSLS